MSAFRASSFFLTVASVGAVLVWSNMAVAQGGRGFGNDGGLRLLSDGRVQEELELVDDQIDQLDEIQSSQRDEMREMFMGMRDRFRDMPREERQTAMEDIREEMKSASESYVNQAKEVLLPHQVTRWEQLKFQSEAQRAGGADRFMTSGSIAEKLNITDEQIEAMKEKAAEVRETMQEKIAAIRAEARDELLSVLTPEQQAQYKELAGDSFTFDDRDGGRTGRDGGGRGGRGGGRDGGGRGDRGGDREGGGRGDRGGRPPADDA